MKNQFYNVLNEVRNSATTFFGIVVNVITSLLIWKGTIDFLYEGVAGYAVGTILIITPKAVPVLIALFLTSKNKKADDTECKE